MLYFELSLRRALEVALVLASWLGLTAALGFLARVSVLCVLDFHVKCACAYCDISPTPFHFFSLSFSRNALLW
jgi:hypothetical protein